MSIFKKKNKKDSCLCNHNPIDDETTLIKSSKREMVLPSTLYFFCKECQKTFAFIKDENGYHLKK